VSAPDLRPLDAKGLAACRKAMAQQKRYDRALAFCRQASSLSPTLSTPYTEALLYAEQAGGRQGDGVGRPAIC